MNLTPDDVDAIESMGRGCEDEQEEEEQEEDDDTLVVDEKWDVYMKGETNFEQLTAINGASCALLC